jgi:hypothetical protein
MIKCLLLAAAGTVTLWASADTNQPPTITKQPQSQVVYEGQPVVIEVVAAGTAPLSYQWTKDGAGISGATTPLISIPLPQVTNSGAYQVIVTNLLGAVTSQVAQLTVRPVTARKLRLAGYTEPAAGQVRVPVQLAAQGNENRVEFTVAWDPAVIAYAGVTSPLDAGNTNVVGPAATNRASQPVVPDLDLSRLNEGRVGVKLALPAGTYLRPATNVIAEVNFSLPPGATPAAAALGLLEEPVATRVLDTNAVSLPVDNVILPVIRPPESPALLVNQAGLFWERLTVINPGNSNLAAAWIAVSGLGLDSLSNRIRLENLSGTASVGPVLQVLDLPAGAAVELTAEYFVSDRVTRPKPVYEAHVSAPLVPTIVETGRPRIQRVVFRDQVALVEFNTISNRLYYVQYAPAADATNWSTALPPLRGTGQRVQWIDNGPPKTASPPGPETNRFYRILQSN